jgi:hypothetical protein
MFGRHRAPPGRASQGGQFAQHPTPVQPAGGGTLTHPSVGDQPRPGRLEPIDPRQLPGIKHANPGRQHSHHLVGRSQQRGHLGPDCNIWEFPRVSIDQTRQASLEQC